MTGVGIFVDVFKVVGTGASEKVGDGGVGNPDSGEFIHKVILHE